MKTPLDCVAILFAHVGESELSQAISGSVYKLVRPKGSVLEDVVINPLPVNGSQIQLGTANVNIYVPDLKLTIASKPQTVPDTDRLKVLSSLASQVLEAHYDPYYNFRLVLTSTIAEPETSQHYINLRIDFQFFPS